MQKITRENLIDKASELLANGTVSCVLGWGAGEFGYDVTPTLFKTVDEITESQALDTDLKLWANAQGWKLSDEDQSIDISVDYDFDPEDVKEGTYKITFWTTGREFKIHTTDYSEVGQEVGLTFYPEDIHVMSRMVF